MSITRQFDDRESLKTLSSHGSARATTSGGSFASLNPVPRKFTSGISSNSSTSKLRETVAILEMLVPGKCVDVKYNDLEQKGIVRFVGTTGFAEGIWVGVELEEPNGKNNGSVLGQQYFECHEGYGIFVRAKSILRIRPPKPSSFGLDGLATDECAGGSNLQVDNVQEDSCASTTTRDSTGSNSPDANNRKAARRAIALQVVQEDSCASTRESTGGNSPDANRRSFRRSKSMPVAALKVGFDDDGQPSVVRQTSDPQLMPPTRGASPSHRASTSKGKKSAKLRSRTHSAHGPGDSTPVGENGSQVAASEVVSASADEDEYLARRPRDALPISPGLPAEQVMPLMNTIYGTVQRTNDELQKEKRTREKQVGTFRKDQRKLDDFFRRVDDRLDMVDQRLEDIFERLDRVVACVNTLEDSVVGRLRNLTQAEMQTPQNSEFVENMARRVAERVQGHDEDKNERLSLDLVAARRELDQAAAASLQRAAMEGTEAEFLQLVRRSVAGAVSQPDLRDRTAVHFAAMGGNLAVLSCLNTLGVDMNAADADGLTAVHYTAACKHEEALQFLADHCSADLAAQDVNERTPADWAVWCGHTQLLPLLSAKEANSKPGNQDGPSVMHWAASSGHTPLLRSLSRAGLDVNALDAFGMTPLHYAAVCGHSETVDFLAVNGGNLRALDRDHRDAVYWATWCKQAELVRRLASDGFKPRPPVLVVSAENSHQQFAGEYVLSDDTLPNGQPAWQKKGGATGSVGMDCWIYTSTDGCWCMGNDPTVGGLVKHEGQDSTQESSADSTPDQLSGSWSTWDAERKMWKVDGILKVSVKNPNISAAEWAASHGHVDLLKCMASAGLNLEAVVKMIVKSSGVEENTDSDTSAKSDSSTLPYIREDKLPETNGRFKFEMLTALTEAGADLNLQNEEGRTLVMDAASDAKLDVIKSLRKVGARLSVKDHNGSTATHLAARDGQLETLQFLAENKADIQMPDGKGDTPLHHAAREGHLEVVKWLISQRADPLTKNGEGLSAEVVASKKPGVLAYFKSQPRA